MKRVEENEMWSLFCPNEAPGLDDCYGGEFEALYHKYEEEEKKNCRLILDFGNIYNNRYLYIIR